MRAYIPLKTLLVDAEIFDLIEFPMVDRKALEQKCEPRVRGPAYGTLIVFAPCSGHSLRGIPDLMIVWNCIVSRCRQRRSPR